MTATMPPLVDRMRHVDELTPGAVLTDLDRAVLTGWMQLADGTVDLYLNGSRRPHNVPGGKMLAVEELETKPSVANLVALAALVDEAERLAAEELATQEQRERERAELEGAAQRAETHGLPAGQPAERAIFAMSPWGGVVHRVVVPAAHPASTPWVALCGVARPEGNWRPTTDRSRPNCARCARAMEATQ